MSLTNLSNTKLVIVIVTHNSMPWIANCLDSCASYPVIVVDNASTDASVSFIEKNYSEVIILKQSKNLGFGKANNIGISYALKLRAEHVFLLNQDAYLVADVLRELVSFQIANPIYGVLSPIHITADKNRIDRSFLYYMLHDTSQQFFSDFVLDNALSEVYNVPFVNAAAWLLSRDCIKAIGGFDPIFSHYCEDENYCQRVLYHGFKIGVLPQVYVVHDRSERIKKDIVPYSEAYFTLRERFYKKYYANILIENTMEVQVLKVKKLIVKAILQLHFKRARSVYTELKLIRRIKPEITKSRQLNCQPKAHYITTE